MLWLFLLACPHPAPPATPLPCPEVAPALPIPSEVVALDARITILLEAAEQADQQERLYALRDLLITSGKMTPEDRQRVGRYAEQILAIEERSLPMSVAEPDAQNPIENVPIEEILPQEPPAPEPMDPSIPAPTP